MPFDPILVITRPKYGVLTHYGVRFSDGTVYDYVPGVNLRRTDDDGFAEGHDVAIVASIPWEKYHLVRARLEELQRNPRLYNPITFNCEDFVNWLISGEAKSGQVIAALSLLALVAFLAVAAK